VSKIVAAFISVVCMVVLTPILTGKNWNEISVLEYAFLLVIYLLIGFAFSEIFSVLLRGGLKVRGAQV